MKNAKGMQNWVYSDEIPEIIAYPWAKSSSGIHISTQSGALFLPTPTVMIIMSL